MKIESCETRAAARKRAESESRAESASRAEQRHVELLAAILHGIGQYRSGGDGQAQGCYATIDEALGAAREIVRQSREARL